MKQKRVFKTIFGILAILLAVLPFLVAFNEALTKVIEEFVLYTWVQEKIVPLQVGLVSYMSGLLGVKVLPYANGMLVKGRFLEMTWNCIGWQSLLLFGITLFVGLKGHNYTRFSKAETILYGILGIFWINILRLTAIVAIYNYLTPAYTYVYHDYFAAIITVVYLFVFWWFAYKYVLEEKIDLNRESAIKV